MLEEKKALAVLIGEAWATRMVDKQRSEGARIGGDWPGSPDDVAILVAPLSADAAERHLLGQVILTNARRAWLALTEKRRPGG
jgi:hypothetical protein